MLTTTQFLGLECVQLGNSALSLLVTKSVGPRVLALRLVGGENLLAELPDTTLESPGAQPYHLYGGHRLWHAPESRRRTYMPDDDPVAIQETADGLEVTQPTEKQTGIQKAMRIALPDETPTVVIEHILTNQNLWPLEFAPWAITKLKTGGTAILPQRIQPLNGEGLRANRPIILWPYTRVNSPELKLGDRYIFVEAQLQDDALKIGYPNSRGWLAYWQQGTLFVKQANFDPDAEYYDFGSSSQCYCNHYNLELETLGPRAVVQPGAAVQHREVWRIYSEVPFPQDEDTADEIARTLELDRARD